MNLRSTENDPLRQNPSVPPQQMKVIEKYITDGLIVAAVPAFIYLVAHSYEIGYARVYNIPSEIIFIDVGRLFNAAIWIIIMVAFVLLSILSILYFKPPRYLKRYSAMIGSFFILSIIGSGILLYTININTLLPWFAIIIGTALAMTILYDITYRENNISITEKERIWRFLILFLVFWYAIMVSVVAYEIGR